jgi:hypothetical protein
MAASNVLPLWDHPYLQWVWPVLEALEGNCGTQPPVHVFVGASNLDYRRKGKAAVQSSESIETSRKGRRASNRVGHAHFPHFKDRGLLIEVRAK